MDPNIFTIVMDNRGVRLAVTATGEKGAGDTLSLQPIAPQNLFQLWTRAGHDADARVMSVGHAFRAARRLAENPVQGGPGVPPVTAQRPEAGADTSITGQIAQLFRHKAQDAPDSPRSALHGSRLFVKSNGLRRELTLDYEESATSWRFDALREGFHRIFLNDNPYGVPASWNCLSDLDAVGDLVRLNEDESANAAWTFRPPASLSEGLFDFLRRLELRS